MNPPQLLEDFLDPEKCAYFIDRYEPHLQPSFINDKTTGERRFTPRRTSWSAMLDDTDPEVIELKRRASALTGLPFENIETLQMVRYREGEQFMLHYDYFTFGATFQRVHTVLLYLNGLCREAGGATYFPSFHLRVTPKAGRAVWFRNTSDDGSVVYPQSVHAGEPVTGGHPKYAINIWVQNKRAFT